MMYIFVYPPTNPGTTLPWAEWEYNDIANLPDAPCKKWTKFFAG